MGADIDIYLFFGKTGHMGTNRTYAYKTDKWEQNGQMSIGINLSFGAFCSNVTQAFAAISLAWSIYVYQWLALKPSRIKDRCLLGIDLCDEFYGIRRRERP